MTIQQMTERAAIAVAASCLVCCAPADRHGEALAEFDLGADFSATENPHGPWSYGYVSGLTSSSSGIVLDGFASAVGGVDFWHPSSTTYYPYVAHSPNDATTVDATSSWAIRPGQVAMEGSGAGEASAVQFTSPVDGSFSVHAEFEGIHFRLSSTDVHVRRNGVELFATTIDGYGGDPSFHATEGAAPAATYEGTFSLSSADIVTFEVGVGANMTNFNDTTGVSVHIDQIR